MNPEGFPLHGTRYEGDPAQPGGPNVIKSTTLSMVIEPPKDHIIWSVLCFVYFNPCCLGLAAFIHSIKSRDRQMVGDLEGARHYGSTARKFNIAASIAAGGIFLINIVLFAVIVYSRSRHN